MLFNSLSVILVWIISSILFMLWIVNDEKEIRDGYSSIAMGMGVISTLIFMWIMSWQNLWR